MRVRSRGSRTISEARAGDAVAAREAALRLLERTRRTRADLARRLREKGYELACVLPVNAIFVRADLFPVLHIEDNSPWALRVFNDAVTWLFQTYDGEVMLAGYRKFLWHQLPMGEHAVRSVPRWLRGFPAGFGPVRRGAWVLFGLFRAPSTWRELLRRRRAGTWDGVPPELDWRPPDERRERD